MSDDVPTSSPWIGSAYRHVPAHADILNFEFARLYRDNRWNLASEQTLYLAGDQGDAPAFDRIRLAGPIRG